MANSDDQNLEQPLATLLDSEEWLPAAQALAEVLTAYASSTDDGWGGPPTGKAQQAILGRLAAGTLLARPSPKIDRQGHAFEFWQEGDDLRSSHLPLDAATNAVPKVFWCEYLDRDSTKHADWLAGDFSFDRQGQDFESRGASGSAHGVSFNRSGLPGVVRQLPAIQPAADQHGGRSVPGKRGRPTEWDWIGALAHVAAFAHHSPDGLHPDGGGEPTGSHIARLMEAWFIGTAGKPPADSLLRKHAALIMVELNTLKSKAANKSEIAV